MVRDPPSRLVRLFAVAAACVTLSGCYYVHVASGQLEMSGKREPIAEIVARPDTDPTLRTRLELAARARDFATAELGLPDNGSYRAFADLGRRYATWNVFAAPEFSIDSRRWCFPVAGCVSYRGYFDEARAAREADKLRARGFDTFIGPSIAYSTLGHLRDPVLNTMLAYGDTELVALLFHELAHQAVYAQGDSDFNEAFASVVENEGVQRWLAREGRPAELEKFVALRTRQGEATGLMVAARARLAALYAGPLMPGAMRAEKAAELARLRAALAAGGYPADGEFNNARLVAVATYERCVPALRAELERLGNDLRAFYATMRELAARPRPRYLCRASLDQVFRQNRIQGLGPDAEPGEPVDLADAVDRERPVVIGRERFAGHEVADRRLQPRGEVRHADHRARKTQAIAHPADDLLQRHPVGSAELVALAGG
ncbi:MAG: aminopeptidase [Gammaproteobacteria bacterium]|nr:aminopeptidase [Gammaproteobacteria bacterium]